MRPVIQWGVTLVSVVTVAGAMLATTLPVGAAYRVAAASVALLILPGLVWSWLLLPPARTASAADWVERLGLSFGLSLALVPVGLLLTNGLGISLTAQTISLFLGAVTMLPILILAVRRTRHA